MTTIGTRRVIKEILSDPARTYFHTGGPQQLYAIYQYESDGKTLWKLTYMSDEISEFVNLHMNLLPMFRLWDRHQGMSNFENSS